MFKTAFKETKSILASIGRCIKQAARWVAKRFGYKAEKKFGRVIWGIFTASAIIIAACIVYNVSAHIWERVQIRAEYKIQQSPEYCHDYWNRQLSYGIIYHDEYDEGYIYNKQLRRRTVTGISWIRESQDGDNLVCFSNGERRGYFDRYTGELVIPAQYEKAWIFSEGLACVMLDGKLGFIDHEGNLVIDNVFDRSYYIGSYCFHGGLCLMKGDNGRIGLIDKQGDWVVTPEYVYIDRVAKGYWKVSDSCWRYGLLNETGQVILPCKYANLYVDFDEKYIHTRTMNHVDQVFDMKGNMVNPCDFFEIESIEYPTDDYDDYGTQKKASAHCLKYRSTDDYYGLMNKDGKIITLPLYSSISAISADRYLCKGLCGGVILDDKGNVCGEKL